MGGGIRFSSIFNNPIEHRDTDAMLSIFVIFYDIYKRIHYNFYGQ